MVGLIIGLVILAIIIVVAYWAYKTGGGILCSLPIIGGAVCKCPSGTTLAGGKCWSCPAGMQRTLDAVNSDTACSVAVGDAAAWCQKTTGNSSAMADLDGNCIACPSGYARVDAIAWNQSGACNGDCTKLYKGDSPTGSFEDGLSGKCYTCPTGMTRTAAAITADNACLGNCADAYPSGSGHETAFQDSTSASDNSPSCWACPSSAPVRTLSAVWNDDACGPSIFDGTASAIRLGPNSKAGVYLGSMTSAAKSLAKWKSKATASDPKI